MNYNWPFEEASKDRVVSEYHSSGCGFREIETRDKFGTWSGPALPLSELR